MKKVRHRGKPGGVPVIPVFSHADLMADRDGAHRIRPVRKIVPNLESSKPGGAYELGITHFSSIFERPISYNSRIPFGWGGR